jgi:hypothetical protein
MPGAIKETATEQSSFKVTATFYDESGNAVAPDTIVWTLTDEDGSVVNSREDVAISSPTSTESILLKGDDLAVEGNDPVKRIVTFEGTYTSAEFGASLPLIDESVFTIMPITIL